MDTKFKVGRIVLGNWQIVGELSSDVDGKSFQVQYGDDTLDMRGRVKVISVPTDLQQLMALQQSSLEYFPYIRKRLSTYLSGVQIMGALQGSPYVLSYGDHLVDFHPSGMGFDLLIRTELLPTLAQEFARREFSRGEVLALGVDICCALEQCHSLGLIHGDVSPLHIYLGRFGSYKLGDFAVPMAETVAGCGSLCWDYMAPELYEGLEYDHRADIYSLGLVLYSLLNQGRLPFYPLKGTEKEKDSGRARRMRGEEWVIPVSLRRSGLGRVISKACHFEARSRFWSVAEFRQELELVQQREAGMFQRTMGRLGRGSGVSILTPSQVVEKIETTGKLPSLGEIMKKSPVLEDRNWGAEGLSQSEIKNGSDSLGLGEDIHPLEKSGVLGFAKNGEIAYVSGIAVESGPVGDSGMKEEKILSARGGTSPREEVQARYDSSGGYESGGYESGSGFDSGQGEEFPERKPPRSDFAEEYLRVMNGEDDTQGNQKKKGLSKFFGKGFWSS